MKRFNLILSTVFLFSCNNENKETRHSTISKNDKIKSVSRLDDNSNSEEAEVDMGFLRKKLQLSDRKVVELSSMANPKNVNKEIITGKSNEAEYFTTFLGKIKVENKSIDVFKQFYTIQAAIEQHGHSEIILLDKTGASYFDMNSGNLPFDLYNGVFRYVRENDTLFMKIEHLSESDLVLRNIHSN